MLAYKWYSLASSLAPHALAIKLRDALAAKMTPNQIAEAQRMAREWLEQHPGEQGLSPRCKDAIARSDSELILHC